MISGSNWVPEWARLGPGAVKRIAACDGFEDLDL